MVRRKSILFVTPYPIGEAPSQRFRFEQYFDKLEAHSIEFEVQSFLTTGNWRVFYSSGKATLKALALVYGFWRRIVGLFAAWRADYIFIHREASPIGPPIFEWIYAKVFRKKIIYDYDDAIWLTDKRRESLLHRLIKSRGKISSICKWSFRVSCGNAFLAAYAQQFNSNVIVNPTTIDTERMIPRERSGFHGDNLVIGWTGSHSTLKYLEQLERVLQTLEREQSKVSFIVIADKPPALKLDRLEFVPWNESTEVADLLKIDIGIMPLPDDEWSKGKCGFKILQYMSLCIPSVSAKVGANTDIVKHGENGFLCSSEDQWLAYLRQLIHDESLRQQFGIAGRETVLLRYSVTSNSSTFLSLFA